MTSPPKAAAVVYALDPSRVAAFYAAVAGLVEADRDADHVLLVSDVLELAVVRIPSHLAATIDADGPDAPREETPIKLAFGIASFEDAEVAAAEAGGTVFGPEGEWTWGASRVRDAIDPEGNVLQLRVARG